MELMSIIFIKETGTPCDPTRTSYNNNVNTGITKRLPKSISSFISGYKSSVTTKINTIRNTRGEKIWQRNYYDIIIRNENAYHRIVKYIRQNPYRRHKT